MEEWKASPTEEDEKQAAVDAFSHFSYQAMASISSGLSPCLLRIRLLCEISGMDWDAVVATNHAVTHPALEPAAGSETDTDAAMALYGEGEADELIAELVDEGEE
eukprot:TRINITY_DN3438_c0_g1_i2.p1 TRINITY_DN3438_c0_g1~~TRINITY_DN3438_c0_g1_i2.p1  ORF type:complete len:105 (-),score=30.56 TRINITY_DN3438_c0_g1_i2:153-467(-)